ncbi:MAG: S24 family peptidase [Betaproteobacteria bacterium]|nr:S24 family peptidase [Betaproteobacteria bacterium]
MPKCNTEFADAGDPGSNRDESLRPGRRVIPIHPLAHDEASEPCSGGESFALMVLGDSMAPEFVEGEIVVIEPDGLAVDGSYVLALVDGGWIFRQLRGDAENWALYPLNAAYPTLPVADLSAVRGVIIQKSKPGRRRASKRYVA